ncbi:MAG: serine/threonine protein kinase [Deltaproteobacteria bacterium]|nr:serine/threonine protein kinase [Deltaproteobacteria bacterium]
MPSRLGKYELVLPLAAGGMARIYIGRATGIGSFERHVVLKLITPEKANDHTAVQMFLDEARLAASLNHQNVAQVFEVGEDQGIHYLAMEYVHGQDSRAVLAKAGSQGTRIPLELALTIVAGAAAGLHHAHERRGPDGVPLGIVHRDVSPSNIMIAYDGAVKLLDFGIAKATARSVETQSGIIKGKFAYMAPEQCRGRDVDRRSDVFSLGIILYEISTQHRCFRADSDFDTMHRIVTGDVVRPTRLIPGYPQALEAIVMKALAVDPAQRYQSAGQLLEALESYAMSARMPMSTMALGRFMRDMFGDVSEPWLNQGRGSEPVITRENTISSTNGSGPVRAPNDTMPPLHLDAVPEDEGKFPDSGSVAGRTVLDLPRDHNDEPPEPREDSRDWNAKSYPSSQPSLVPPASPQMGSSYPVMHRDQLPGVLPHGAQPLPPPPMPPPPTAFTPNPGSGSGSAPAHPAMPGQPPIVSTRHGYASAVPSRGDVSYPRYDAPPDAHEVQLKPNRRPLLIGGGIALVGIIVLLAVSFSGGSGPSKDDSTAVVGSDTPSTETKMTTTQPVEPPAPAVEDMVTIKIVSDPAGADVLIAGQKIGVTPLDTKLKRGSKLQQLTIRMAGYQDITSKIDLGGDYSNEHVKLVAVGADSGSAQTATVTPPPTPKPPVEEHKVVKTTPKPPVEEHKVVKTTKPPVDEHKQTTTTKPPAEEHKTTAPKPKCQPPNAVDPFSSLPVCPH